MTISNRSYDAVVIGSGPNGLAAAITIAQAGRSVLVIEGSDTIGGGARSKELTLPRYVHDVCSAVHPMAASSAFFGSLPLAQHGLEYVHPTTPVAHPLDDGTAVLCERSIEETAAGLGEDRERYIQFMSPLVSNWRQIEPIVQGDWSFPKHPLGAFRFGLSALQSASGLAKKTFRGERARALFAGMAAHSILPLESVSSAAAGIVIGTSPHTVGWPFARGGSQNIANALASFLRSLGGDIITGTWIKSLDQLPPSRAVLCDQTPRQVVALAGHLFPSGFRRKLERYRYGPGSCKVDWALDAPIPWKAKECARAGTVHIGGTLGEIAASERNAWNGQHSDRPFVLLAQPTLFDSSRAPEGKHTAWAYCHVPNGSSIDVSEKIEGQIERFAPGFQSRILKRHVTTPPEMENMNPNLVGGDVAGGASTLGQLFTRPTWRLYCTPAKNIYICSSSTPPGAGVHGMCGHWAAKAALRKAF
jgi:phytoene dehydrogenase-like protein